MKPWKEKEQNKEKKKKRGGNQSCSIYPQVQRSVFLADNRTVLCVQIKAMACCCETITSSGITNIVGKR